MLLKIGVLIGENLPLTNSGLGRGYNNLCGCLNRSGCLLLRMIVAGTLNGERAEGAAEVWEVVNGGQAVKPRALGQVLKPGFGAGWRQRRS